MIEDPFGMPGSAPGTAVAEAEQPATADRLRPVLVTGAAGLVGSHVCDELSRSGWKVRALVRDPAKGAARLARTSAEIVVGDIRDRDALVSALGGAGAVIHLAAIAIERRGQSYEQVNTDATALLVDVAREHGVERMVHMSQNGADSASPHRFLRSKGIAEERVKQSSLRWTVLRPSVIFGPEDEFVNVLARLVRLSPIVFPLPGGGTARFQPIAVGDVARAVRVALEKESTVRGSYPIGGPAALTLRQMAARILLAMNTKRVLVGVPVGVLWPLVWLSQRLLPSPPVTTSLLDLLAVDNTVPGRALQEVFDVVPTPFAPEEIEYVRRITTREALASLFRR